MDSGACQAGAAASGLSPLPAATPPTRLPRLPSAGLSQPPMKKPAAPSATPAALSPTPVAMSAPNCGSEEIGTGALSLWLEENYGSEEDAHNAIDEMPASDPRLVVMMTDDVGVEDVLRAQPFASVNDEVMEATPPTRKRGQRTANYSTEEDVGLVLAWENIALDAGVGTDQNSPSYWKRIEDYYHCNVKTPSSRSLISLQHRWCTIQECCNKWAKCVEKIKRLHPSGVLPQEQVNYAQELYKQMDNPKHKSFMLFHCWALLEHNEKWIHRNNGIAPLKRPKSSHPFTPKLLEHKEKWIHRNNGIAPPKRPKSSHSSTPVVDLEETMATRKELESKKKLEETMATRKELESKKKLEETTVTRKELESEKKLPEKDARLNEVKPIEEHKVTLEERKLALEEERVRLMAEEVQTKKNEQEQKIMFMDTSNLDETQRAYVDTVRSQILASLFGASGSGSV